MKRLKGLYKDALEIDQPEGTYRHAKNINLNDDVGSVSSEQGNQNVLTAISGDGSFIPLAYETAPDGRIVVWFVTDSTSGIGIYNGTNFTVKLDDPDLKFTKTTQLSTTLRLDKKGSVVVYWTDNVEPPRTYNLTLPPSYSDIRELNIFDFIADVGKIELSAVSPSGGSLKSGSYMFAMRYIDDQDNKTNFFAITRPVSIVLGSGEDIQGTDTVITSKRIELALSNLDTSYQFAEIAVIRYEGETIAETSLLPKVVCDSANGFVSYGGQFAGPEIALEEIVINKVSYNSAKTLTQLDDVLYMANLKRDTEIDYQTYANNIKAEVVTKIVTDAGFEEEETAFFSKSFRRGEVYAFYVAFVLDDGTETEAFHIPGRESEGTEKDVVTTSGFGHSIDDFATDPPRFRLFAEEGTNGFAYWENDINSAGGAYPNNDKFVVTDIATDGTETQVGDLRGQPVRHHRFPDEFDQPVLGDTSYGLQEVFSLGVKFSNIKIPASIKSKVKGVKFYYAEKNNSNRINIDEGFAIPQYTATSSDWDVVTSSNIWRNEKIEKDIDDFYGAVSLLPFTSLRNQQAVTGVDYLLRTRRCKTTYMRRVEEYDMEYYAGKHVQPTDKAAERAKPAYITSVGAIAYYPHNTAEVTLVNKNFSKNKSSFLENSGILVEAASTSFPMVINGAAPTLVANTVNDSTFKEVEFGAIYTMCSYRVTVHSPFSQEVLVTMGNVESNIDKFDPTDGSYSEFLNETQHYYSGDTYLSKIGHLVSYDRSANNNRLNQAVIHTLVQSYENVEWRYAGEGEHDYNPNNTSLGNIEEILNAYRQAPPGEFYDNYYAYDEAHSVQPTIKSTIPDQAEDVLNNTLPTRVIRSAEQDPETREDSFRIFLENDYLDLPSNRGEIKHLARNNNILIVHAEKALFRTRGKEELATGDFRAFLGSGDIFEIQPTEIYNTKNGYAGIQDVDSAVETKSGYFFVDTYTRKPYLVTNTGNDLSEKGMKKFFRDNLNWYIDEARDHNEIPFVGMVSEYDEIYDRILLTKVDYEPTQALLTGLAGAFTYNASTGKFNDGTSDIEYSDATYFTDKSFTISYLPQVEAWVSLHDYKPLFYINDGYNLYSVVGDTLYKHNSDNVDYCNFYGNQGSMEYQFVQNEAPATSKHLVNLEFITKAVSRANGVQSNVTISRFRIRNDRQDSLEQGVTVFPAAGSNVRDIEGTWRINKFRDLSNYAGASIQWYEKKRFIGKYALVDVYYDNPGDVKLSLVSASANFKQSIR